jgi:hypothetical protein
MVGSKPAWDTEQDTVKEEREGKLRDDREGRGEEQSQVCSYTTAVPATRDAKEGGSF